MRAFPDGGTEPVWAPDGRTLYYRDATGARVYAVPVTPGLVSQFGMPAIINGDWTPGTTYGGRYDITLVGNALLLMSRMAVGRELQTVLNFDESVRRKMSAEKE